MGVAQPIINLSTDAENRRDHWFTLHGHRARGPKSEG